MFRFIFILSLLAAAALSVNGQLIYYKNQIRSTVAIQDEKAALRKQKMLEQANSLNNLSLDSSLGEIETAMWAVSQFLIKTQESDLGVARLVKNFGNLTAGMQRSLMEILYGMYPTQFVAEVKSIVQKADNPKLFAQSASYLFRNDAGNAFWLKNLLATKFPGYTSNDLLTALNSYLSVQPASDLPSFDSLFAYQQVHKYKVIYSFQRSNRNYPGIAIVQNADGKFARDSEGRLKTFVQLARSASNLPYFITNGSTPQGLYAITGTGISRNPFIGPTPNLQMGMLHEINPPKFTHYFPIVFNAPPEKIYRSYFPESWQQWSGLMEAYNAGKIGRSEIIAHGTTIDPSWFSGQTYYPISPTLGCLCGREIWNAKTGQIEFSDQLDMVNTFIETPGTQGYMMVINVDNQNAAVEYHEVNKWVQQFEAGLCNN